MEKELEKVFIEHLDRLPNEEKDFLIGFGDKYLQSSNVEKKLDILFAMIMIANIKFLNS